MTARAIRHDWWTAGRAPYLGNLKVMRRVLEAVKKEVAAADGRLVAYLFRDDRAVFVVEGGQAPEALARARRVSEDAFRSSDRKPLWGRVDIRPAGDPVGVRDDLDRLARQAGVPDGLAGYPWCAGPWLSTSTPVRSG